MSLEPHLKFVARLHFGTKLVLLMGSLMGLVSLVIFLRVPPLIKQEAFASAARNSTAFAEIAAHSVNAAVVFGDATAARELLSTAWKNPDVVCIVVRDLNGRALVDFRRQGDLVCLSSFVSGISEDEMLYRITTPILLKKRPIGTLFMTISLQTPIRAIRRSRQVIALLSVMIFLVGMVAVAGITAVVTRPLSHIVDAARRIGEGDLSRRVDVTSHDEIGHLAYAFNDMIGKLASTQSDLVELNRGLEARVNRRTAELRVEVEERRVLARNIELLLESTTDGVFATGRDGVCTLMNPAAKRLLRVTDGRVIGTDLHTFLHPRHPSGPTCVAEECRLLSAICGHRGQYDRDRFFAADGKQVLVEYSAAPIRDDQEIRGMVINFTDITEKETLRRRLEQANRVDSLGRLAATVAHEFNNVLMGIQPNAEVLARRAGDSDRERRPADLILNAVQRGKRISQQLLRFTRPADPVIEPIDAIQWLTDFAAEVRGLVGRGIDVELKVGEEPRSFLADADQIHQVFTNLVINACDAMSNGGKITLAVSRPGQASVFSFGRIQDPASHLHFTVADTGEGMTPDTLEHIFDPLFTAGKKGGTGLGLTVAQQVVSRHHGEIFAESSPGKGSTFHIFLPLTTARSSNLVAPRGEASRKEQRLLVVEDDAVVAAGLSAVLEISNFKVRIVDRGLDAELAVNEFNPDAVILDIGLPDIDGVAVFRILAARWPNLPVVFSTGHGSEEDLGEITALSHVGFLLKPYTTESLLRTLEQVGLSPGAPSEVT